MDLIFSLWKAPRGVLNNQYGLDMKARKKKIPVLQPKSIR